MEYITKVCGEVASSHVKAYAVDANSEEEAIKVAKQNFQNEYLTNGNVVVIEKPYTRKKRSIIAIVAMIIPILLSLISWKNGHNTISISPNLISCIFGVLIYSAFVIRFKGIQRTVRSTYDILFAIISVILISTFISIILVNKQISLLGGLFKIPVDSMTILVVAVILSWVGLKLVSLVCLGAILLPALNNIIGLNAAMGTLWGSIYIISSFLGVLMYASVEPAFMDTRRSLLNFTKKSINHINNDFIEAKTHVSKAKNLIKESNNSEE